MVERADTQLAKSATFVGELRLKYKHCFESDNVNNWQWQQLVLTDEENKVQRRGAASEVQTCQVNLKVRYLEAG